jgi:putative SOS response-associated peptidase YedK
MTYSDLTTEATGLMAEIHNSKKRMPLVLSEEYEQIWLNEGKNIIQNKKLIASECD